MTNPTLTVEIGHLTGWTLGVVGKSELGTTTNLASLTYDNITSKVRSLSIRRGRNHELDRVEAGTASVRLLNQDGAFNPTNTTSIYYPNIRPMIPLRIRAIWATQFVPTDVTGLVAWWDFADITSLWQDTARTSAISADGQIIKGVTDKSNSGNHLSEATNGPAYKVNIQNSKSVGRFDGTNDVLGATVAADNSRTTFIVCTKRSAPTGANQAVLAMGHNSHIFFTVSGSHASSMLFYQGTAPIHVLTGSTAANWTTYVNKMNSLASCNFYVNGGTSIDVDPNDVVSGQTDWALGSRAAVFSEGGDYDIGEVLLYNSPLAAADLNSVGNYFADKWGLTWTTVT